MAGIFNGFMFGAQNKNKKIMKKVDNLIIIVVVLLLLSLMFVSCSKASVAIPLKENPNTTVVDQDSIIGGGDSTVVDSIQVNTDSLNVDTTKPQQIQYKAVIRVEFHFTGFYSINDYYKEHQIIWGTSTEDVARGQYTITGVGSSSEAMWADVVSKIPAFNGTFGGSYLPRVFITTNGQEPNGGYIGYGSSGVSGLWVKFQTNGFYPLAYQPHCIDGFFEMFSDSNYGGGNKRAFGELIIVTKI